MLIAYPSKPGMLASSFRALSAICTSCQLLLLICVVSMKNMPLCRVGKFTAPSTVLGDSRALVVYVRQGLKGYKTALSLGKQLMLQWYGLSKGSSFQTMHWV